MPGSQAHDEIFYSAERGYYRETNRAGGLEGGMTTGQPLIVRGAMKPLPTLTQPLRSVDTETHEPAQALRERTDSCTVPAAAVVGEAMVALVLARAYREKFGGDHIDDMLQAAQRIPGADRLAPLVPAPARALVFIGFMGPASRPPRRRPRAALGVHALDSDRVLEERLGHTIAEEFESGGEAAFRAARGGAWCWSCCSARRPAT